MATHDHPDRTRRPRNNWQGRAFDRVAEAANEREVLATLVKGEAESAADLMKRLEEALDTAACRGVVTNEIEGGELVLTRPSGRRKGKG